MFERFSDRARKVMKLANQEALRLKNDHIGTEHILLGLAIEGSGVGANALRNLGVSPTKVRVEIEKLVRAGAAGGDPTERLPQTPRAKKSLEFAIEEARNLNHDYVGTEHLLLGLLRAETGVAAVVLGNFNVTPEKARQAVLDLLASAP